MSGIYIVGDTHGEWNLLNTFINKKRPDLILQVGDFGYWPQFNNSYELGKHSYGMDGRVIKKHKWYQCGIKNKSTRILFCDGNHEDHWALKTLKNPEVCPSVFYQARGTVVVLEDGRNVLFLGGADSIDKDTRTIGVDWFPDEVITNADIYNLPDTRIDIVISHTCPEEFIPELGYSFGKCKDPSCKALSYVLYKCKPSLWYFGHWHINKTGFTNDTRWVCLNMAVETGWFEKLKA